jgi:hypothetical protein
VAVSRNRRCLPFISIPNIGLFDRNATPIALQQRR